MSVPDLPGIEPPEYKVFAALVKVLKSDPGLKPIVADSAWQIWDGSLTDQATPQVAKFPYVSLYPVSANSQWEFNNQHKTKLDIKFMVYVSGTNWRNLAVVWNMIRLALFPDNNSPRYSYVYQTLWNSSAGWTMLDNSYKVFTTDDGSKALVSDGTLSINVLFNT
jgi:hypothetical protein